MSTATWASDPWVWRISFKPAIGPLPAGAMERGVLFRGEMVRAIIEGRKTLTRRVLKSNSGPPPALVHKTPIDGRHWVEPGGWVTCPFGKPGDRLWCRETWSMVVERPVSRDAAWWVMKGADGRLMPWPGVGPDRPHTPARNSVGNVIIYRADGEMPGGFPQQWKPSIFMPRWACRLVIEVTDVRVERLQDISDEDAIAEGIEPPPGGIWTNYGPRESFRSLWSSIHG